MAQDIELSRIFNLLGIGRPIMEPDFSNRIKYQKIVYLLQAFGLNLGYGFSWYLKGPYSSQLAHVLYSIFNDEQFYDDNKDRKFKNDDAVAGKIDEFKSTLGDNMDNVLYLEVLSSLHYINKSTFSGKGQEDKLKDKLFEVKQNLRTVDNIDIYVQNAFQQLKSFN